MQVLTNCHCKVLLVFHLFAIEVSEGEDAHGEYVCTLMPIDKALDELEYSEVVVKGGIIPAEKDCHLHSPFAVLETAALK